MELKQKIEAYMKAWSQLLIVPYGIETFEAKHIIHEVQRF